MRGILEGIKRSVREKVRSGKEILRIFRELRKEETKEMLALLFRESLLLLKKCRIRKCSGTIYFAMEDPYRMAQVLEGLSLLYPVIQDKITLVPAFHDSYYYGRVEIKGKIRFIHVLFFFIHLWKNKQFRKLILRGGKNGK